MTGFDKMKPNLFTRRRPKYYDVLVNQIMDVKALGAKGDGTCDDRAVLNAILDGAANTSSIVYFPYGVYIITDTLRVPIGSRIIGQAWAQIMASGSNFQDELRPRAAVQVGRPGDTGIIEIQDMLFTVSGPTAGAVVVEWNAHEDTQGSVGLWGIYYAKNLCRSLVLTATSQIPISGSAEATARSYAINARNSPER